MQNWEMVYESQLIPLVRSVDSEANLWKCVHVVVGSLFQRQDDEPQRVRLIALFNQELVKARSLDDKVAVAIRLLRVTKNQRIDLARKADGGGQRNRAEPGRDIDAVASAVEDV